MCYTIIKDNGNPVLKLMPPVRKVALWHVTEKCNMECKYCYGTFGGSSYKNENDSAKIIPLEVMLQTVDFLKSVGVNRIHLCGGEPFLYPYFEQLLDYIYKCDIESYVLSNVTFLPKYVERLFREKRISNMSFSLDSLDEKYNISIRGIHDNVIENINRIIGYKREYHSNIEIGLYVVATRKNLDLIPDLIDWAIEKGINYITLQAVYLPKEHPYYDELTIFNDNLDKLNNTFGYLTNNSGKIRISGSLLRFITDALISKEKLMVENCFVEHDFNYFFIDGDGNIKTCATKDNIVGNICSHDFPQFISSAGEKSDCAEFCLDCIGIWEMAYPEEVNKIILPVSLITVKH